MMLWLWLSLAWGQEELLAEACAITSPIAGTAGFDNARQAARVNANTYAAGAFARRRMREQVIGAVDARSVYGVALVPFYCDHASLFRSDVISVQAGYTGRRGVYADVTQEKVALFVNGVLDELGDGLDPGDLSYWMGGCKASTCSAPVPPARRG